MTNEYRASVITRLTSEEELALRTHYDHLREKYWQNTNDPPSDKTSMAHICACLGVYGVTEAFRKASLQYDRIMVDAIHSINTRRAR